jgi:hypothetical protein
MPSAARKAKKAIIIQPILEIPTLPSDFQEKSWSSLAAFLQAVYTLSPLNVSKEELYRLVNNLCLHDFSDWLFNNFLTSLTGHIAEVMAQLSALECTLPEFVGRVLVAWREHNEMIGHVRDVFLYLERVFILPKKGNRTISDLGISLLKQELEVRLSLKERIVRSSLELIDQERRMELDHSQMLKELLSLACSLGFYESHFEGKFISQTAQFYREESRELIDRVSVPEFLDYIEKRLGEEAGRATKYLHISSTQALIGTAESTLIVDNSAVIIDRGFTALLEQSRISELSLLFKLLVKAGLVPQLKKAYGTYIRRVGREVVVSKENPEMMIDKLLEFKLKIDGICADAFSNHSQLVQATKNAWEAFINLDSSRPPELLANYIDERLKKSSKKRLQEAQVDSLIDELIEIFRFIAAKDVRG